jgi:transcriptional regulator with XRE-family HTH domain
MRVRKVQEVDISDLPDRLLAARKASRLSLLEICRQLEITPTYWYKLERREASTISYELLRKIESLLSLDLGIQFSNDLDTNSKEIGMDLSRMKWVKVVTPPNDYQSYWAYTPKEITSAINEPVIHQNGLTIFPLGFKQEKAEDLQSGDLIMLTQHSKVTHIVEILDEHPYEKGGWYNRYVKIIWWKPDLDDWGRLPDRTEVLDCDLNIQGGIPYKFTAFKKFNDRWGDRLEAFQQHVAQHLVSL